MTRRAVISIRFLDWWHAGTGQSGTGDADMHAYRDRFGCPAMPMTQVKGVLRETAEIFGLLEDQQQIDWYFGERSEPGVTVNADGAAIAFTGETTLSIAEQAWFKADRHAQGMLFSWQRSTAIDDDTGSAQAGSLRSIEVCTPMTLSRVIEWIDAEEPPTDWWKGLDQVCAMTPVFGKQSRDGLGRAIASCHLEGEAPQ